MSCWSVLEELGQGMALVRLGNWRWERARAGASCWGWWQGSIQGHEVVGQVLHMNLSGCAYFVNCLGANSQGKGGA